MKKILTSVGMLVFVAAIVAGGTGAFFSDTETSTGNVFTAGSLDLKVDSVAHINGLVCYVDDEEGTWLPESVVVWVPTEGDVEGHLEIIDGADVPGAVTAYNTANPSNVPQAGEECEGTWTLRDLDGTEQVSYTFFDYSDLKPGDEGENTISLHVVDNDAYMCATVNNVADLDNSQTEPEGDAETDPDPMSEGELDEELELVIWEDDGDNILETAEVANILVETDNADGIEGVYSLFTPQLGAITGSTTAYLGVYWCYGDITREGNLLSCDGSDVGNVSQTDSLKADISFYVEQARHNEDFACTPREEDPETASLTVDKIVTFSGITIDVDVSDFTLHISDGDTIDMDVTDEIQVDNLPPGNYVVSEVYTGGQDIDFVATFTGDCADAGDTGTVTLADGDDLTCVVTNQILTSQPG